MPGKKINSSQQYDIVIVGGGLVGATLAIALQSTAYRVALIESADLRQVQSPSYDDRSIALSYGSRRILEWLDLWPAIAELAEPILSIHISDRGHFGSGRIDARAERVPALGYVIESRSLGEVLLPRLLQADPQRLQLYSPAQPVMLRQSPDAIEIVLAQADGEIEISGRLLIAADGANSGVRGLLNIGATTTDYQQQAIIANVSTQLAHRRVAYERFTASGPLAFLPIKGYGSDRHRCAIVWTLAAHEAEEIEALPPALFLQRLQHWFGQRLGRLTQVGKRARYPLTLVDSDARTAPRAVLIGNAAQALHPVAGQGFNLALRDAAVLLECLLEAGAHADSSSDPGEPQLLMRYRDRRVSDQRRVIRFTDGLVRTFSNDFKPLARARAFSLLALDLLPTARRWLVRQSMGVNMPLPKVGRYRQ
jgi:2-octaprenyl-6-methoxyphenol hydroxylase